MSLAALVTSSPSAEKPRGLERRAAAGSSSYPTLQSPGDLLLRADMWFSDPKAL